ALTRPDDNGSNGRVTRGFRVRAAGGLSTSPENAHLLYDFLPDDELLPVLEAIVRVFDRTGNRANKSRARLKYVVRKLGWHGFRAEFEKELAALRTAGRDKIAIDGDAPTIPPPPSRAPAHPVAPERAAASPGFSSCRRTNA